MNGAVVGVGQAQNSGQYPGNRDNANRGAPFGLQKDADAQSFVEDVRKGMGRIDDDRRQDRFQLFSPVAPDESEVLTFEVSRIPQLDALAGKGGKELLVPALVHLCHQFMSRRRDSGQLLIRGEAVGSGRAASRFPDLQQPGDPDLKELVKVAGYDGDELDPLQQRILLVLRLLENAAIEIEPRQLSIDVKFGL